MNVRHAVAAALAIGFAGLIWTATRPAQETSVPADSTESVSIDLTTSASCRECHEDVWQEWESSFHGQSFTDPLVLAKEQSNNFRDLSCIPCHAPSPVLEHGIGKNARVVERVANREYGVDCLACHKRGHQIAGRRTLTADVAPCQPIANPALVSTNLCAPCHNQHETVNEWEASSFPAQNIGCLDCHMAPVERIGADGKKRMGRSHVFPGGHDPDYLRSALDVEYEVTGDDPDAQTLTVTVINSGAGHNYPTDARHRALDLIVTLIRPDGLEVPARETLPPGQTRGTQRRRFRNPYRTETLRLTNKERYGRENTQIPAEGRESMEVPFSANDVREARIEVIYKLTPLVEDEDGARLYDRRITLP